MALISRTFLITASALALGAAAACSTKAANGEQFTKADIAAIKQAAVAFTEAFNAKRTEQVLAHYPETVVFMPPNAGTIRGKEWLKGYYDSLLAAGTATLTLDAKEVVGHGPVAYQSGSYSIVTRTANGEETRDRGKYLFVLRRTGGRWLYEQAIWNSDLPRPLVSETN